MERCIYDKRTEDWRLWRGVSMTKEQRIGDCGEVVSMTKEQRIGDCGEVHL